MDRRHCQPSHSAMDRGTQVAPIVAVPVTRMALQHADAADGSAVRQRGRRRLSPALRCRRKFLRVFPGGFRDDTYLDWERDYKWQTHQRWNAVLDRRQFAQLLRAREFGEIA